MPFLYGVELKDFLVQGLDTDDTGGLLVVCMFVLICAFTQEGLRQYLLSIHDEIHGQLIIQSRRQSVCQQKKPELESQVCHAKPEDARIEQLQINSCDTPNDTDNGLNRPPCHHTTRPSIIVRILQTIVHITTLVLIYAMMLAVMSYNIWVLVALSLGSGLAYFIFSQIKSINLSKYCR